MRRWFAISAVLIAMLISPALVFGQALADHVPQDAMVYVGWKGSDSLGAAYEQSHLKAVLDASNLPEYFQDIVPKLLAKAAEHDREGREVLDLAMGIGSSLWRHPSALYIGPVTLTRNKPVIHAALLCDAGTDAAALANQWQKVLDMAGHAPIPVAIEQHGSLVAFVIGQPDAGWKDAVDNAQGTLAASQTFKDDLKQVGSDPVACFYFDYEAYKRMIDSALATDSKTNEIVGKLWEKLGMNGVKRLIITAGFDGRDWVTQQFLEAPAPRSGILAVMEGQTISDDQLKLIPKDSTFCIAARLDVGNLFALIRGVIDSFPESAQMFDDGLKQANQIVGFDIEKDFLDAMGSQWTAYCDPNIGGANPLGFVVVNRAADAGKLEKSLSSLESVSNNMLRKNLGRKATISFEQTKAGDLTLHYLNVPFVTPTWTIQGGDWYLSLYPQVTQAAAQNAAAKGPSILENEAFTAMRKRLGDQKAMLIMFADLPKTAPQSYASWVLISRLAAFGDVWGVKSKPMLLPTLPKIMENLGPTGQVSWADAAGIHSKAICSFPGSTLIASNPASLSILAAPAAIAVLIPSLDRAREMSHRAASGNSLRQIGMGCMMYSNEHGQAYPPDLGTLVKDEGLRPALFVSPSSSTAVPPDLDTPEKQAAWVNANSDFVYLGAGKTNAENPDVVMAYEKLGIHHGQGANVLFADGHVEWLSPVGIDRYFKEQKIDPKY